MTTKQPETKPVSTPYGHGSVMEVRSDDVHVVQLKYGMGYLHHSAVAEPESDPALDQSENQADDCNSSEDIIKTPYGHGNVKEIRSDEVHVVQLKYGIAYLNKASLGEKSTEESNKDEEQTVPEDEFKKNSAVVTPYGNGKIVERRADGVFAVELKYGTAYLTESFLNVAEKGVNEMTITELIEKAHGLSQEGNGLFKRKQYIDAVQCYLQSLGYLNFVDQDNATHKQKAGILQTMIRCHLNISASKLKQGLHNDAITASTNAITILSALAGNRTSNVVVWLERLGVSNQKLYTDWPLKGFYRRAQGFHALGHLEEAKKDLQNALIIAPTDKPCRSLLAAIQKEFSKQKKKEMKTWGNIFNDTSSSSASSGIEKSSCDSNSSEKVVQVEELREESEKAVNIKDLKNEAMALMKEMKDMNLDDSFSENMIDEYKESESLEVEEPVAAAEDTPNYIPYAFAAAAAVGVLAMLFSARNKN